MIKVRILRLEDYLGLSGYAQRNNKGPYKREAGGSERKGNVMTEAKASK